MMRCLMWVRQCAGGFCVAMLVGLGAAALSAQETNRAQLVVQLGHTNNVTAVAFSADGRYVLTSSSLDGSTRLWEAETGRELRRFGDGGRTHSLEFSPDGRTVLTATAGDVQLWDAGTGKKLAHFSDGPGTFSPDGRTVLTGGADHLAHLWDVESGREVKRL